MADLINASLSFTDMVDASNVTNLLVNSSNHTNGSINEDDDTYDETVRLIHVIGRSILIVFGTIGNLLAFYVMRRGSLKNVSTCFYMAILALADTGKCKYIEFQSILD